MYRLINENVGAVINSINRTRVIDPYITLLRGVRDKETPLGKSFKESYRKYWGMNAARLGDQFYTHYFSMLERCRQAQGIDVRAAAAEVAGFTSKKNRRSVQFSFSTKLVHMLQPNTPIYDSSVRAFFFIPSVDSVTNRHDKVRRQLAVHAALVVEYRRIIKERLLAESIGSLRAAFSLKPADYSDTKTIDTLIWSFVSFMRRQTLDKRLLLYRNVSPGRQANGLMRTPGSVIL